MTQLKRRQFLRNTIVSGLGASFITPGDGFAKTSVESVEPGTMHAPQSGKSKRVIVAGAGIAGLCCAYELMKLGHEVTVLEASGRHGGHVFTIRDGLSDGLYADGGAELFTKPGYERYWEYTREFNLSVLPYPCRRDMLRHVNNKFYTDDALRDPETLKSFGLNDKEVKYMSEPGHTWWDLRYLYMQPYLDKFKDEYQPFGIGYDHLDTTPIAEIYKKEGASPAALRFLGGEKSSALQELWKAAILKKRGINAIPVDVYRLKGGNQGLPDAFAKRLGSRIKLNCPILSINNEKDHVSVAYREFGEEKEMKADFLANCIPPPAFRKIPVTPSFSPGKQYVIDHVAYGSYCHFIFQASSKFWLDDGFKTINMQLDHPDIYEIWQIAEEVDTHRVVLLATGPGGVSPERALAGFRAAYPGKKDTIEQALVKDWTKDPFAPTCERVNFPMGELKKFWPQIMAPAGRIHFAGAYADNLNWGQEAATRSANRVAQEIDKA
ncbi:MAG: NAD(P)/FAD-dependent oxidoreductase [Chitinophagaceae bacterium]|nr:NAD(P)/FAD-dependent oxidoreductase [Chitinophagaceae bacterium]